MATGTAAFATGIPLVNSDEGTPIPGRFVLQHADEFAPADIMNSLCQRRMLHHRLHLQTLDAYRLVLTNQASRELLQEVRATVSNAGMDTRDGTTSLIAVLGAELLFREASLRFGQLLPVFGKEMRIAYLLAAVEYYHIMHTEINTNLPSGSRQRRDLLFDQDADEVATSGIATDGHGSRLRPIRQGPRPVNRQRGIHLGEGQGACLSIPAEGRGGVFRGLHAVLLMEVGVLGLARKEVAKCTVKVPERLLGGHTRNVIQPRGFWLLLQRGQRSGGSGVANPLLALKVGVGAQPERPVVDKTRTAERPRQHSGLRGCRIAAIAIGAFLSHAFTVYFSVCKAEVA